MGRRNPAKIIDYALTINGLEVYFGPLKGFEGNFWAAFTDIPETSPQYDKDNKRFFIIFKGSKIKSGLASKIQADKRFYHIVEIQETEEDCRIILDLKDSAKYYRCIKGHADPSHKIPYARFILLHEQDYDFAKYVY